MPDWDFQDIGVKHFSLTNGNGTFRAYEVDYNGSPVYCILGKVVKDNGIVDYWRDCQSKGSVFKHINKNG